VTTTQSEQLTGISDAVLDLSSVFYHAAEGSAAKEGDTELVEFFKELQEQDAWRAQKAKSLIGRR
jgi:hypothetical protein